MTRPLLGLLALTTVLVIGCGSTPEGDPNPPATPIKPAPVTTGGTSAATATPTPDGTKPAESKPTESKLTVPGINPPAPTGGTGVTSGETKAGEVAPKKPGPDPVSPTSGQGQ